MTIMDRIANLLLPTEVILILMHVVVFSGDGLQLDNPTFIQDTQTHYLSMVYRYTKFSFYSVMIFHLKSSTYPE
jgi:hypothetical protein